MLQNWQNHIKGRDQQIRAAKVCLPSKTVISRRLNLLYPIECPEDDKNTDDEPPESGSREKCQSGDRTGRSRPQRQTAKRAVEQISRQLNDSFDDQDYYS